MLCVDGGIARAAEVRDYTRSRPRMVRLQLRHGSARITRTLPRALPGPESAGDGWRSYPWCQLHQHSELRPQVGAIAPSSSSPPTCVILSLDLRSTFWCNWEGGGARGGGGAMHRSFVDSLLVRRQPFAEQRQGQRELATRARVHRRPRLSVRDTSNINGIAFPFVS